MGITGGVWEAAFWGFVGGFALLVGAGLGLIWRTPPRVVGIVMAFGAGVLISAVAFELVEGAFDASGALPVVAGLVAGALTFYVGDLILDKRGAKHRKRSGGQQASGAAGAIVLGAMLDGVPESVAIGASLLGGGGVGVAVVAAVFLSNVPESLSAATGLRKAGHSPRPGFFTGVMGLSPELQAWHFDHGFLFVGRVGVRLSRRGAGFHAPGGCSFHDRRGGEWWSGRRGQDLDRCPGVDQVVDPGPVRA